MLHLQVTAQDSLTQASLGRLMRRFHNPVGELLRSVLDVLGRVSKGILYMRMVKGKIVSLDMITVEQTSLMLHSSSAQNPCK